MLSEIKLRLQENKEADNYGSIIFDAMRLVSVLASPTSTIPTDQQGNPLAGPFIYGGLQYQLEVIGPLGESIRDLSVIGEVNAAEDSISVVAGTIPRDTVGEAIAGVYTFNIKVIMLATGNEELLTYKYELDCNAPVLSIGSSYNCQQSSITISDNTEYGDYVLVSRELSMAHPSISNENTVRTDGKVFTTRLSYDNSEYNASLKSSIELVGETEVYANHTVSSLYTSLLTGSDCVLVSCSIASCQYIDALAGFLKSIEEKACKVGGFQSLSSGDRSAYQYVTAALGVINGYFACGETDKAIQEMQRIATTIGLTVSDAVPVKFESLDGTGAGWTVIDESNFEQGFQNYKVNNVASNPLKYKITGGFLVITGLLTANSNPNLRTIIRDYFSGNEVPDAVDFTPGVQQYSWGTNRVESGIARLREYISGLWSIEFQRTETFDSNRAIDLYLIIPV